MKKILSLALAMLMTATFAGCGASQKSGDNKAGNVLETADQLVEAKDLVPAKTDKKVGYQLEDPEKGEEIAVVTLENGKSFKIRFFPNEAPKTVYNFKKHAIDGYYNGLTFHRVISNFMIQGGDPNGNGTGGTSVWDGSFEDEFSKNLININGSISMANSGQNTNGSQFFINNTQTSGDINWDMYQQYYDLLESDPNTFMQYTGRKGWLDMKNAGDDYKELYNTNGGNPTLDGGYTTDAIGHTVFAQVFEGMDVVTEISNVPTGESDVPIEPVVIQSIEIVVYE
ncbi:peptidylprolyl isomerase [Scatolibacter rhodanostii]|uniref:peptidylprolyl isomerase n=1 Tax=Scatolibacter rhodanostii TaxID=2014781 RepID=UPI00241D0789|nr:peptidylprolyl isomerase [Scatolibacter rhodanostii]